jgi:cyclic beta-1,2-glucan synthetase
VAAVARLILDAVDGVFSGPTLHAFMQAVQAREPLNVDELWFVGTFLKFALLELILGRGTGGAPPSRKVPEFLEALAHIKSLRTVSNTDWVYLIEPLIVFDALLRQDPANAFEQMDFESRELYRKRIAFVARRSDCSESQVAQIALELAREGETRIRESAHSSAPRTHRLLPYRQWDFPARFPHRLSSTHARSHARIHCEHGEDFYITGIQLSILSDRRDPVSGSAPVSGFIGLIHRVLFLLSPRCRMPSTCEQQRISAFFDPEPLPKLDFSDGIPAIAPRS